MKCSTCLHRSPSITDKSSCTRLNLGRLLLTSVPAALVAHPCYPVEPLHISLQHGSCSMTAGADSCSRRDTTRPRGSMLRG